MIKLKSLLNERLITIDEVRSRAHEFFREIEDLEGKDVILAFLAEKGFHPEVINLYGQEVIVFSQWVIDDPDYPQVNEIPDWLSTNWSVKREAVGEFEEKFNKMFWDNPATLYHNTKPENIENIKKDGLKVKNDTRGFTNKSVGSAVFTHNDPDFTVNSPYGNVVVTINTKLMKQDGYMPFVTKEPNWEEQAALNLIAHKMGYNDEINSVESWDGTNDATVIVHGSIPAKYLSYD
jgi:hypothetical protein